MPSDTWRDVERWVAKDLCGERVHSGDKSDERDVRSDTLSVEVKHRITAIPANVQKYVDQIRKNKRRGTIPFVYAHKPGTRRDSAVVYIEYGDFKTLLKKAGLVECEDEGV